MKLNLQWRYVGKVSKVYSKGLNLETIFDSLQNARDLLSKDLL